MATLLVVHIPEVDDLIWHFDVIDYVVRNVKTTELPITDGECHSVDVEVDTGDVVSSSTWKAKNVQQIINFSKYQRALM